MCYSVVAIAQALASTVVGSTAQERPTDHTVTIAVVH